MGVPRNQISAVSLKKVYAAAGTYVDTVVMYRTSLLKGYEYCISFYEEKIGAGIDVETLKLNKEALIASFNKFDQAVAQRFLEY